ncbi:MAG: AAA family ATPase [Phycisphaera sp.]|nr:AAA family ATPase [Phycisphaera sp.]
MTRTIRGTIGKVHFASPKFSAGIIDTDHGKSVRFRGKFCATEGDVIAADGEWHIDQKYGPQFVVKKLRYDLPPSADGLKHYLSSHPAFVGIGDATANKIVEYAGDSKRLDDLIRNGIDELREKLRVPMSTLESLQTAWIANAMENDLRGFLAGFGLTHHQMNVLIKIYGDAAGSVLRADPYKLIEHVRGYGFKRVDKIARAAGLAKDHPGRVEAGVMHCLREQIKSGHTWTAGSDLVHFANDLLLLDSMDSHQLIREAGQRLLDGEHVVAENTSITTRSLFDAERLIFDTFARHGWAKDAPLFGGDGGGVHGGGVGSGGGSGVGLEGRQAEAFGTALSHRVCVISGGAGTGKTYVVAHIARSLIDAGKRVKLCAPTGKAAKRIEQVMRGKYGVSVEAQTIHRMLEYNGSKFGVEQVDADMIIVDEVSMVDTLLMADLLRRVDIDHTRLVLVGDHNQLPPVGPGNVLRDVIDHGLVPTVVFDRVFRQAGVLRANSAAVLAGEVRESEADDTTRWAVVDRFAEAHHIQTYIRDLVLTQIPDKLGYDPIRDVQVLTPTHKGPLGTRDINKAMQLIIHGDVRGRFTLGDKVIQTSNDYTLGVMNGTIGFVVGMDGNDYLIDFEGSGVKTVGGERLNNVDLAYALTAHKAQGSEFPCVVVICHKSHYFADRNWLYTAVTRASQTCVLVGDRWGIRNAAKKNRTVARRTLLSMWSKRDRKEGEAA